MSTLVLYSIAVILYCTITAFSFIMGYYSKTIPLKSSNHCTVCSYWELYQIRYSVGRGDMMLAVRASKASLQEESDGMFTPPQQLVCALELFIGVKCFIWNVCTSVYQRSTCKNSTFSGRWVQKECPYNQMEWQHSLLENKLQKIWKIISGLTKNLFTDKYYLLYCSF